MTKTYQEKDFIMEMLITYLQKELNIEYFKYKVIDFDYNIADVLVKKDSPIFEKNIQGKDFINFNVEELIDSRIFKNENEIIIVDLNFDDKVVDLEYLLESLNYKFLSYSEHIKEHLFTFVDYVINKK